MPKHAGFARWDFQQIARIYTFDSPANIGIARCIKAVFINHSLMRFKTVHRHWRSSDPPAFTA